MRSAEPSAITPPVYTWLADERLAALPSCAQAIASLTAARLTQLGARAGLVCQLTGVDKALANRLYRQIHGRPSPPGQTPFSDAWYLKSDRRMLHAAVVWRLYQRFPRTERATAQTLIDVHGIYRVIVRENLLDITHVAFVPRLVEMQLWTTRCCAHCAARYIAPVEETGTTCPGCRLYQRYRCLHCGAPAEGLRAGRRRAKCPHCARPRLK